LLCVSLTGYKERTGFVAMQFIQHDLGYRQSGEIIEVTLTAAANVRLMDSSNLNNFKNDRQHRYYGGLAERSPLHLQIPHSGTWYVTVDMQGLRGSVRSAVRILPGPLPVIREAPLSSVPSLVQRDPPPGGGYTVQREYDVFISHASEDKDSVVRFAPEDRFRARQEPLWSRGALALVFWERLDQLRAGWLGDPNGFRRANSLADLA
jgi:hypothetical protein